MIHSNSEIIIQPGRFDDVPTVVDIHLTAFTSFFLTSLGPAFLGELYMAILADPDGISLVATQHNKPCGFAFGTSQPAGFYRRLIRQRWWRFGLAAVGPTLRKPSIAPRLLRAFTMTQQTSTANNTGILMSIAVAPRLQTCGAGQKLVNAFLQTAAQRQISQINLTTDTINNEAVNRFYQKQGFQLARTFVTPEGRQMNEYAISLEPIPKQ
jgi:ribosomal protein S18 acetylase RimI-like enzyme